MKDDVFLIQAPVATPTEPPMGITQLAGYLRSHGLDLTVADLSIEFLNLLMTRESLERCLQISKRRLTTLDELPSLDAQRLLAYVPLLQHASLDALPERIQDAIAVFRDHEKFFDFEAYLHAARTSKIALGLVSATVAPFRIDFTEVSSSLHNFDNSNELFQALDDFRSLPDNLPLELLNRLLDKLFSNRRPKIVGISITYAHQLFFGMLLARLVRLRFPETYLVLGGPLVATIANRGRKVGSFALFRDVDAVSVSDGEVALRVLIEHVLAGKAVPPTANLITFDRRTGCGGVPEINVIDDLDELPCGDFNDLQLSNYWSPTPVLPLPIARGCYWDKCTFCFYGFVPDGRRATAPYRERSVDKIVEDIAYLNRKHGCHHFDFTVDLVAPLLLDRIAVALPDRGLDVKWMLEARAERNFTRERCDKLKAGGMSYAAFGLESMDQNVLNAINKGTKVAQYSAALSNFYNAGIATHAMGFFDFPGEDYEAARASIEFLRANDEHLSEVGWGRFMLDLGSQVERNAERFGLEVVADPEDDLTTTVRYAQKTAAKSLEQRETLEQLIGHYRLECDKVSYLGRPFFTGGSLEPHCLIYAAALGPSAPRDFNRFAKAYFEQRVVEPNTRLRIAGPELLLRYPVKDAYRIFQELLELLSDDKAGPLLTLGQGAGKSRRVRRLDNYHSALNPMGPRRVLASPDQIAEINETQWQLISNFSETRQVAEVLELYEDNAPRVQAFLRKALSYGWLEAVR